MSWTKISMGLWMGRSNVIEKISLAVVKMVSKKGKEGEFSPALTTAASLDSRGEGIGSGGLRLSWCWELAHVAVRGYSTF